MLTYEQLLVGALSMARRFRDLPGDNVGLLLPASVACDVALMGLYLAGKLPVRAQLDDRPGQSGPRREDDGAPARRHLQGVHRPRRRASG